MKEKNDNSAGFDDNRTEASSELKQLELDMIFNETLTDVQFRDKVSRYLQLNHYQN